MVERNRLNDFSHKMNEENKLRFVVPKGKLIRPERFNVADILELAEILKVREEGGKMVATAIDKEVEPSLGNAKDIPYGLSFK